jgi:hypothetical protein
MIAGLEAGLHAQRHRRERPGASPLRPASGLPRVSTQGFCQEPSKLTIRLRPPLASERLQFRAPQRRHAANLKRALCLLIASVIAGSIAYHVSQAGSFLQAEPRQVASLLGQ